MTYLWFLRVLLGFFVYFSFREEEQAYNANLVTPLLQLPLRIGSYNVRYLPGITQG